MHMGKLIAALSVVGMMMLGSPHVASAGDHDNDDHQHRKAPEPLTVIGLALGAGVIGVARWASKRKSR